MAKYRKKPVVIEAFRYIGPVCREQPFEGDATASTLQEWGAPIEPTAHWGGACGEVGHEENWHLYVGTREDGKPDAAQVRPVALVGDWIIRGVKGEFYPVKDDIFRATYEPAD